MDLLQATIARIEPVDENARAAARARQDSLTKPPGSLGRLEELAVQVAAITGRATPTIEERLVFTFCGDHGVVAEGVSAFPGEVTPQMVRNFTQGGAAINVLARWAGARSVVVDVGVAVPLEDCPGVLPRKVRPGTANLAQGPALTRAEAVAALEVGIRTFAETWSGRPALLALGEMGIGITTPAAAIAAAITGLPPAEVTGRGTGVDDARLAHKCAVIQRALDLNRPDASDGLDVLAKVGGLEIAAMAGAMLAGAAHRVPVVLDGFICGAAALVAAALAPRARDYFIAGHCSVEPGHRAVLAHLGLKPVVELDLRLGEGTGATLAIPIIDAACRLLAEMATFAEAGVASHE